jgi:hypothetical protein
LSRKSFVLNTIFSSALWYNKHTSSLNPSAIFCLIVPSCKTNTKQYCLC